MNFYLLSMMVLTASILLIYKMNRRLSVFENEHQTAWSVTNKIIKFSRVSCYLSILLSLPALYLIFIATETTDHQWIVHSAVIGRLGFSAALLALVVSLFWRSAVSPVSWGAWLKHLCTKTIQVLKPHWKKITIGMAAITVVILLIPYFEVLLYIGFMILMRDVGLLNEEEKDNDMELVDDIGFMSKGLCFNYRTRKYDHGYEMGGVYADDD